MTTETTNPLLTRQYAPNYMSKPDSDLLQMSASDYSVIAAKYQEILDELVEGASAVTLSITQVTAGAVEQQTITASAVPTAGQYFLNYGGGQTPAIQWDDNAAAVQSALRQIDGFESVTVAGSFASQFTVTFTGVSGNISNITASGDTLVREATATLSVAETTKGVIETQTLTAGAAPASGTYVLNYAGHATAAINWDDNAAAVQAALRLVSGLSAVTVAGSFATHFTVTFAGVPGDVALLTITSNSVLDAGSAPVTLTMAEGTKGVIEVQTISSNHTPISGQYKITYSSNSSIFIPYDADAATIQAILRAVSGLSTVTVTGSLTDGIVVTFAGMAGDISALSISSSDVIGRVAVTLSIAQSVAGAVEVQKITPSDTDVDFGSYVLNYGGYKTAPISAAASASDIKFALRNIPGFEHVSVSGSFATFFSITFTGVPGDISLMTVSSDALYVLGAGGPPDAHAAQDEFRRQALAFIYDGKANPKYLADFALQAGNIDYIRSYNA